MCKSIGKSSISDFYCTCCGRVGVPLPRKVGKSREPGHLKDLYCIHCKSCHNHAEVRPFGAYSKEDFEIEFNHGNFDEHGLRKIPYRQFVAQVRSGTNA